MLISGVIPTPPATSTISRAEEGSVSTVKLPIGSSTTSASPARTRSWRCRDTSPSGMRLTVIAGRPPARGELENE